MTDREPVIIEKACWERGCACYDHRVDEGVNVTLAQREWVGLTNDEVQDCQMKTTIFAGEGINAFARAIEAKLKEKNT